MIKLYLKSAVHGLTSEQADEIVKNATEMCVKRWTVCADYECYVVYLSKEPKERGQRSFGLEIEEYRRFCDPLKWSRDYRVYTRWGKIEFAVLSLTGCGSQFEIGAEPQWTIGL